MLKVRVAEVQRQIAKQFGFNVQAGGLLGSVPVAFATDNQFALLGRALSDISGISAGQFVFVSGQLALRPGDKELTGGTIEEQTQQVIANLRAILEAAGSGLDRLVKTTVFLQNLGDFQGMNDVYAAHVGDTPPARSTVEVAKLPSGALVEIEAVALI